MHVIFFFYCDNDFNYYQWRPNVYVNTLRKNSVISSNKVTHSNRNGPAAENAIS